MLANSAGLAAGVELHSGCLPVHVDNVTALCSSGDAAAINPGLSRSVVMRSGRCTPWLHCRCKDLGIGASGVS